MYPKPIALPVATKLQRTLCKYGQYPESRLATNLRLYVTIYQLGGNLCNLGLTATISLLLLLAISIYVKAEAEMCYVNFQVAFEHLR
jgi:hypothetical protein